MHAYMWCFRTSFKIIIDISLCVVKVSLYPLLCIMVTLIYNFFDFIIISFNHKYNVSRHNHIQLDVHHNHIIHINPKGSQSVESYIYVYIH